MKHNKAHNLVVLALITLSIVVPVVAQNSMPGMTMDPAFAKREQEVMPFKTYCVISSSKNRADTNPPTLTSFTPQPPTD